MAIVKQGKSYAVRISYKDTISGKYKVHYKGGFRTYLDAEHYVEWYKEEEHDNLNTSSRITFYDYFVDWYETYKEPTISANTKRHYKIVIKIIKTFFKKTKLSEVTRRQYQTFINWYGKDHVKESVNKINFNIKECVKSAKLDGLIKTDFTEGINIVYNNDGKLDVEYLNVEEIKKVIDYLLQHYKSNKLTSNSYIFILTGILTGMRLGEIQALTWNDIEFDKGTIDINKSWDNIWGGFKPPKTESSNRTITIPNVLLNILKYKKEHDMYNGRNLVFFNNTANTVPTSSAINHSMRRLFKRLDIEKKDFHFHSFRHSFVALSYSLGVDMYTISKHLGHKNVSMTLDTYSYLIDEMKDEQELKLNKGLNNFCKSFTINHS